MIRVTVELISAISSTRDKVLGIAEICNDGTGDPNTGNYRVALSRCPSLRKLWKEGHVEGFKRKKRGVWDLLFLCLKDTVGNRNA